MKIIRANKIKGKKRAGGRIVKKLLELSFTEPVKSTVIYLCEVPKGKFDKHYHSQSQEIICFPNGGKITVNDVTYKMKKWDMVLLDKGDIHGYNKNDCSNLLHFAIKFSKKNDKVKVKN